MVRCDHVAHVVLERWHYENDPGWHEDMASCGRLYTAREKGLHVPPGSDWPDGTHILDFGRGRFSRDVFKDGVVCSLYGVGSVAYAALQVAYTLGYRKVYALGLDLGGPHFDGSPASPKVEEQNRLFAHVPEELEVVVAGSPESKAVFPKVSVEEVYAH
jgi:hypothetical protein